MAYTPKILAAIRLEDGRTFRRDFEAKDFITVPRAGELFRLGDPGEPVATIERVVWRSTGSVELYLRPHGRFEWDEARLDRYGWFEDELSWTDEAPA